MHGIIRCKTWNCSRLFTTPANQQQQLKIASNKTKLQSFRQIVKSRVSARRFEPNVSVPDHVWLDILRMTMVSDGVWLCIHLSHVASSMVW